MFMSNKLGALIDRPIVTLDGPTCFLVFRFKKRFMARQR
jgi:hypothetical protein